jgi:hypothetical protein
MGMLDFLRLLYSHFQNISSGATGGKRHTLDGAAFGGGTGVDSFSGTRFLLRLEGGGFLDGRFGGLDSPAA